MSRVAIVLAAGKATRFGRDKLAASLGGRTVLEWAIDIARAAPADRVIVVSRSGQADLVPGVVERVDPGGPDLSDSLRSGLAAAGDAAAAFLFLGDMPFVPPNLGEQLVKAIGSAVAAFPVREGVPGHPVLLSRAGFALADQLAGDRGLGSILHDRDDVVRMAVEDAGATFDIDTPADLAAALAGPARAP